MPREKQSKGKCVYCGAEVPKNGVAQHLVGCPKRQMITQQAERKKVESESLYHLRILDSWRSEFWLDVEMRGSGTLKNLDSYLRGIWLECCGHLSRFSIGSWRGKEISKKYRADKIFERGIEITHIYDFGTSSETLIKVVGTREGKPTTTRPIALMVRNLQPKAKCIECRQLAVWLCMECQIEEENWGTLCDQHAETHPHDDYGEPVRLVNSPRLGMCGYDGPAEPPY